MKLTDNEIIESIRKGAKHDFAHLVTRYSPKVMTLAMRMLKNREDAEEAAQDALVRAFNALDRFEGTAKFSTWLYRIVYNVCLTKIGKRREEFQMVDYDEEQLYASRELYTSYTHELEVKEMTGIVKKLIEEMPEKYATMLSLFYFQELSHEEICETTSLPLGTVKTHLFRARLMLQQRMAKEFNIEKVSV